MWRNCLLSLERGDNCQPVYLKTRGQWPCKPAATRAMMRLIRFEICEFTIYFKIMNPSSTLCLSFIDLGGFAENRKVFRFWCSYLLLMGKWELNSLKSSLVAAWLSSSSRLTSSKPPSSHAFCFSLDSHRNGMEIWSNRFYGEFSSEFASGPHIVWEVKNICLLLSFLLLFFCSKNELSVKKCSTVEPAYMVHGWKIFWHIRSTLG